MVRNGADPLSDENATELSRFFDHLVDCIPAKYYHEDTEQVDIRFMRKAARAEAKASFKEKRKESKLARLDPDTPSTALELQQAKLKGEKAEAGEKEESKSNGAPAAVAGKGTAKPPATINFGGNASKEELKERLAKKIESARQQRHAKEKVEAAMKAKEWKQKTLTDNAKQKRGQQQQQEKPQGTKRKAESSNNDSNPAKGKASGAGGQPVKKAANGGLGDEPQFAFPRIDVSDGRASVLGPKGKKKPSKEQLLRQAEAKQKQMQELAGTAEGKEQMKAEAWKSAFSRATGEKVLDDPKLLRKSLKKEAKKTEKNAKAWKERHGKEKEAKDKKQAKRTQNLKARTDQKIQKKKDKREKKLLRAGFEGRKEGFIGSKGAGAKAGAKP